MCEGHNSLLDADRFLFLRKLLSYSEVEQWKQLVTVATSNTPIEDSWTHKVMVSKASRAYASVKKVKLESVTEQVCRGES